MDQASLIAWRKLLQLRDGPKELPRPNLIGVGSARAGSTTLFHIFRDTPGISMSPVKELGYFAHNYERWSEREYLVFFEGTDDDLWRGEVTPHYLQNPESPARIRAFNPHTQIIIQLRDPVQRTLSHFRKHQPAHRIDDPNEYFDQALVAYERGAEPNRWAHAVHNLRQSFVHDAVERYCATFPAEQIHVIFLDDLKADPVQAVAGLQATLGVDLTPHAGQHMNTTTPDGTNDGLTPARFEQLTELFADDWARTCARFDREPAEFTS